MTALTYRQTVAVNAVLAMVHASGRDANAISREAKAYQAQGHTHLKAYEAALATFTGANPNMSRAVQQTLNVVCASSDKTVDQYHYAITRYRETGNTDAIDKMAPVMAQDSVELAIRNGEITREDVASGGAEAVLGMKLAPETVAAVAAHVPVAVTPATPGVVPPAAHNNAPVSRAPTALPQRRGTDYGTMSTEAAIARLSGPTHGKTGEALARWHGLPMAFVEAQQASVAQDS